MVWKGSPHGEYRTDHELTFRRLDGPVTERFDCGEQDQNEFLSKHAWDQQQSGFSTTYVAYVGGMMVGYISLALSEIRLPGPERLVSAFSSRFPALNIALGFVVNLHEQERREREAKKQKRPLEDVSVSMRLDIRPPAT